MKMDYFISQRRVALAGYERVRVCFNEEGVSVRAIN